MGALLLAALASSTPNPTPAILLPFCLAALPLGLPWHGRLPQHPPFPRCPGQAATLRSYIEAHHAKTNSSVAAAVLGSFDTALGDFVKVMPSDYKRVLAQMAAEEAAEPVAASN